MNAINFENDNKLKIAEEYYGSMLKKDFETMAAYLCEDVHFIGPLSEMRGRESVVSAAKNLAKILESIDIRCRFSNGTQIMFVYDFMFPDPIGKLRSSVVMDFKNDQISRIELFYDGRPFEQKKEEIFRKSN